jgi:hypothetical protein
VEDWWPDDQRHLADLCHLHLEGSVGGRFDGLPSRLAPGARARTGDFARELCIRASRKRSAFDAYRTRILALTDAIAAASPARLEELCRIVVQRVVVADRRLRTIEWVSAARPFFEKQRECPQGDSNP